VLTSDDAFPVIVGDVKGGQMAVVGAGSAGRGRFVAFGHGGFLTRDTAETHDTGRLILNALRWSSRKDEPKVACDDRQLAEYLKAQGLDAEHLDLIRWPERLDVYDAICLAPGRLDKTKISDVQRFLKRGNGLLLAHLGWGWLQLNPGKPIHEHPVNQILSASGAVWPDGHVGTTSPGAYDANTVIHPHVHAIGALYALEAGVGDLTQASLSVTSAARTLAPTNRSLRPQIERLIKGEGAALIPTRKNPLEQSSALDRLRLTLEIDRLKTAPVRTVRAHPSAEAFPGSVPDGAARQRKELTIDPARRGWHSTGLYAPPGAQITVRAPADIGSKKLKVRIGAHKDTLYHKDKWWRAPEITLDRPIEERVTRIASAFGGLVYIDVPRNAPPGEIELDILGGVGAPRFVLGETDPDTWRKRLRDLPAPWAELETAKVILTVPSEHVRQLDDPVALMTFWDEVLDASADLASIPHELEKPQRYVTDIQISAGYMHSGQPIMTHLDAAADMTSLERMKAGTWGLFHELGHNRQSSLWTFSGTGEVTCNLFSLYIIEQLCSPPDGGVGHEAADGEAGLSEYLADGAPFHRWKSKPFLALRMYQQLQTAFGWEPFKKVFAEYRGLRSDDRPSTDDQKRDQWMVRISREVGRNLGPFFEAWGVPTSDSARESIADLPDWMPEDWPG